MNARVVAAANAISEYAGMRFDGFWSRVEDLEPEDREHALAEAGAALAAADAVMFDDAAVERAARAMFAAEQCDRRQKLDVDGNWKSRLDDRDRDEYRTLARAVIAALKGDRS